LCGGGVAKKKKVMTFIIAFFYGGSCREKEGDINYCMSYIWLCDFIFFNSYILFFEFFMCKVLGFGFFSKVMFYFFIFFGLGPKPEIDQASQPHAPVVHLIWLRRTKNGWRLGWNGNVKLTFTLSHIVPTGCWPSIWRGCMVWW
jgi:hypothetical protein